MNLKSYANLRTNVGIWTNTSSRQVIGQWIPINIRMYVVGFPR